MALEIDGKKYYHIFTAGKYPQGDVSKEDVAKIAAYYDPVNRHEACFWIGHPRMMFPIKEPEALGWVGSLLAVDGKLYFNPSSISEELKKLYAEGKYKRCSIEIGDYQEGDMIFPYLYAIGATNRPAVTPMEPLEFTSEEGTPTRNFNSAAFDKTRRVYNIEIETFLFEEEKNKDDFSNQNYTMKQLIAFAKNHNIALTGETEADVTAAFTSHITNLEGRIQSLEDEKKNSNTNRAKEFARKLVTEGKITADKEAHYTKIAEADYESAMEVTKDMKPLAASAKNVVKNFEKVADSANEPAEGEKKFFNADGSVMSKKQFHQKVFHDPKFAENFTDEEIEKIPQDAPATGK